MRPVGARADGLRLRGAGATTGLLLVLAGCVTVRSGPVARVSAEGCITVPTCERPGDELPPGREGAPEPGPAPSREGPILLLENARGPAALFDRSGAKQREVWPEPSGLARRDRNYAMILERGAFTLAGAGAHLTEQARASGALGVEMLLAPHGTSTTGELPVLTISASEGRPCLELALEGDCLVARAGAAGTRPLRLAVLAAERPSHVVVNCRDDLVVCYVEGRPAFRSAGAGVRLAGWSGTDLVFGGAGPHGRAATLEGVAIYARLLDEEEALAGSRRRAAALAARPPVERLEVRARLLERSPVPEAKDIAPYTRALAVYEYEVAEVLAGDCPARRIRVAHWGLMDGRPLAIREARAGSSMRMRLERFDANPQLESEWLSDALPPDDAPLYYDIDVWHGPDGP